MGIQTTDTNGQMKSSAVVLSDIAAKFATYADGAQKTALAVAIFGKSGIQMIPMLNQGRDGIKALTEESDKFGTTISSKTAAQAKELTDNLDKMSAMYHGMFNEIAKNVLPSLLSTTDAMVNQMKNAENQQKIVEALTMAYKVLTTSLELLIHDFKVLVSTISTVYTTLEALGSLDFTKAGKSMADFTAGMGIANKAIATMAPSWTAWSLEVIKTSPEIVKAQAPIIQSAKDHATALADLKLTYANAIAITQQYLTPLQKMNEAQQKIRVEFDNGRISAETFGRAMAETSAFSRTNMEALAGSVTQNLQTIFGATKATSIAIALINTYTGVTKALATCPPPMSFAMAGVQLAAGMAQVRNITSQSSSGGAAASTSLPSASAVAAQPAAPPPSQNTLTVQGINPKGLFTGDVVAALARQLVAYQKNGGTVVIQ